MAMTAAEKILARASGRNEVSPGQYVTAAIDTFMCQEGFAAVYLSLTALGIHKINDPDRVVVILDHYAPAPTQRAASIHQIVRKGVTEFGIKKFYDINSGICHQIMMEEGHAAPGRLIVGTDSHTCTYGAIGAAATGIGFSDMAYAMATGTLWFMVPETIRFVLSGDLQDLVTSKDVILKIAGDYSSEVAEYKSVEFTGPAVKRMTMDGRMTISNMAVEIGAKFGFFEVDKTAEEYLKDRVGNCYEPLRFEDAGTVSEVYEMDLSSIEPQVALPHSVDNVKPASQVNDIEIQQAVLGSCTNGRLEDLHLAARILKGRKIHPGTRLLVIPASTDIYLQAVGDGTILTLVEAGGTILNPGCGPCFGSHGGLLAAGERCISSTNRNFKGRMGSEDAEVFLASPATVAASAIRGRITDPREL